MVYHFLIASARQVMIFLEKMKISLALRFVDASEIGNESLANGVPKTGL
jgi:hypothetical protein